MKNVVKMFGIGLLSGLLGLILLAVFCFGAAWLATKNILIQAIVIITVSVAGFCLSRAKKSTHYSISSILFFVAGIYLVIDIISLLAAQKWFFQNKFLSDIHFHFVISFVSAVIFIVMGIDQAIRTRMAHRKEIDDSTFQN